jgi:hypothetical protein
MVEGHLVKHHITRDTVGTVEKPIKKSLLEGKSIHLTSNDAAMQMFATSNLTYTREKQRCCEELSNLEHYT